jgi:hypothetical protein
LIHFLDIFFGKNLAHLKKISKIISWGELQAIERGFNFAVRSTNSSIQIISCQLYLSTEAELNIKIDDIDICRQSAPHISLVNGQKYLKEQKGIEYRLGPSLRYSPIFWFSPQITRNKVLVLGAYLEKETNNVLEYCKNIPNITFKKHPASDQAHLIFPTSQIEITNNNLYDLFKSTKIVIGTATGSLLEAVSCGISCIVIASQDNLTSNPLIEYGKGEIWDIAFSKDDVVTLYNTLLRFRNENSLRIQEIASWYKDNFFIEPTEANIINAFDLKQGVA